MFGAEGTVPRPGPQIGVFMRGMPRDGVNGRWENATGKPVLLATRAFGKSPFPGEENVVYGGAPPSAYTE
eukprot:gene12881-9034_t